MQNSVDKAWQTMIDNLQKNTGKGVDEWVALVNASGITKHGEIVSWLKSEHSLGHGYANMLAHTFLKSSSMHSDDEDLISKQYKGKEHLKAIYDALILEINKFGEFEISPKNSYVSLRRKRQFAMLIPATKARFEIGLNLKGVVAEGLLEEMPAGSMCTHKIKIGSSDEIDAEMISWIKKAYDISV